jgi:hypothetical protein
MHSNGLEVIENDLGWRRRGRIEEFSEMGWRERVPPFSICSKNLGGRNRNRRDDEDDRYPGQGPRERFDEVTDPSYKATSSDERKGDICPHRASDPLKGLLSFGSSLERWGQKI